jgi:hypothetical protein
LEDIVNLDTIGLDLSVGTTTISTVSPPQKSRRCELPKALLCPKGVAPEVRDELIEAAVDVCSLPGMLSMVENCTLGPNNESSFE